METEEIRKLLTELEETDLKELDDDQHIEYHDKRVKLYRESRRNNQLDEDEVHQAIMRDDYSRIQL